MAWETGSATDHVDLFNKIRDFLTTNTDLVNAGENWEQMLGPTGTLAHGDQITLRGPGLTDSDNIYFGMETIQNTQADAYNLQFWGHSGYSSSSEPRSQPLKSPDQWVLLWDQPMTYWLVANGRRWMIAVKVSTVYSSAYCGFMLPFASPSEYPYPMVVAGISDSGGGTRWSTVDERSRFFASPGYDTMFLYWPDNVWRRIANYENDSNDYSPMYGSNPDNYGFVFPTRYMSQFGLFSSRSDEEIVNETTRTFDGTYILRDLQLVSASGAPYRSMMGILDGAFWVPGTANSSENIIAKDDVDYLVIQNLFRTGFRDYMALRLE